MEFNVKSRERSWILIIGGLVGLVVLLVAGYLIWDSFQKEEVAKPQAIDEKPDLPRMANLPPKPEAIPPPPPPSPVALFESMTQWISSTSEESVA